MPCIHLDDDICGFHPVLYATLYERAKFNRRKQEDGETVDEFVMDLYRLAEHCEYGILHDELVKDRIVVGIKDSKLSEKLQMTPDLTLESAVIEGRQSEAVKKQQSVVRGEVLRESTIEAVKTCRQPRGLKPRNKFTRSAPRPLTVVQGVDCHRLTVDNNAPPKKRYATNVVLKVTIKAAVKPESALER